MLLIAEICHKSCTVGDGIAVIGISFAVAVIGFALIRAMS